MKTMKILFSAILVIFMLASCKSKWDKTQPVVENISESVYASGIIKSRHQYQVYSKVNGLIVSIAVTEGDTVKKGDPILKVLNETSELNTENARLSAAYAAVSANTDKLNELKINIDLAKVKLANDSLLLFRQRSLWQQQIGSLHQVEQAELAYKSSLTAYNAAVFKYNDLQKQLNFTAKQSSKNLQISTTMSNDYTVKSDINGKVYSVLKKAGEMVNTQAPVAIIGDASDFYLELQADEYDIARIRLGQKVLITLDSYKGQAFEATVEKIYPIMNERSRSFTVDARFVTQPPVIYPNLTLEANIIIQTKDKALTIPRNYLVEDAYVLLENKEKRKVTTGLKDYQKVEIVSGLTAGDVIIKPVK
ncbi:multidrug efflux pump subunit AcrA (membrane-fusion protein) [Chitinophaga niastensis]|uniref:Multidrug efflux pump subunit AcrA (Membrane-fusion protein) n=1 Tax=Chitinophaga niastensis TaxID=536980 RepID=A0A2P8HA65_CHINA|nr:efflux RND transporter periplasmic adaptor subunit [Chitinophaga niastensis]PSL43104.1 multidrug efflux pump subunit AcrA (membrane-fusion protein) [Chitinophaga niastensis]